ncbi:MAG: FHA domain-containing protein [Clostridiales bacterium]|nr:FHA domain-containing protein [Clostridiales bacterium]
MEIRKGPYGQFAVIRENDEGNIYSYAVEMIRSDRFPHLLKVYLSPGEISFDITAITSLNDIRSERSFPLSKRKTAVRDLFLSLPDLSSYLLPLDHIRFDPGSIFADLESYRLFIIYSPLKESIEDDSLSISSWGRLGFEDLLYHPFFDDVFSEDQKQELIYAVRDGDEDLFKKTLTGSYTRASLISLKDIFGTGRKKRKQKDTSQNRSKVLFDKDEKMGCLILSSRQKADGDIIRKAVYTDNTTIGSDRFLSDICIEDLSLSPIQAKIDIIGGRYYVTDLSCDSSTCIGNTRLKSNTPYEIKDGQILRCGRFDFDIKIGF